MTIMMINTGINNIVVTNTGIINHNSGKYCDYKLWENSGIPSGND